MQKDHKFFDDLAKLASNAGGTLLQTKKQMESGFNHQVEKMLKRMDLVKREEFKVVKEMAAKARSEQEKLEKRVAALEKMLAKTTPTKTVTKKTASASASKDKAVRKPSAKKASTAKTTAKTRTTKTAKK